MLFTTATTFQLPAFIDSPSPSSGSSKVSCAADNHCSDDRIRPPSQPPMSALFPLISHKPLSLLNQCATTPELAHLTPLAHRWPRISTKITPTLSSSNLNHAANIIATTCTLSKIDANSNSDSYSAVSIANTACAIDASADANSSGSNSIINGNINGTNSNASTSELLDTFDNGSNEPEPVPLCSPFTASLTDKPEEPSPQEV